MKSIHLLLIALCLTATTAGAQTWQKMTNVPQPNGNDFHTWVWSTDTNVTHIVGFTRNRHLLTEDGGATWQQIPYDGDRKYSMTDIQFLDKNTGFVCGQDSLGKSFVFKTKDGGHTWMKKTVPFNQVESMRFIDTTFGYMGTGAGRYVYTYDGGTTWKSKQIQVTMNTPSFPRLQITPSVKINLATTAPLVFGIVQYTSKTDTVEDQLGISGFLSNNSNGFLDLFARGEEVYAVGTNHQFARSNNGGSGWANLTANFPTTTLDTTIPGQGPKNWQSLSVWFVNDTTGYLVGGADLFLKTTNKGQSWTVFRSGEARTTALAANRNRSVMVMDKGTKRVGWAVGEQGNAWKFTEAIANVGPGVGVRNTSALKGVTVYPNPAHDFIVFNIDAAREYKATLSNSIGQVVRSATLNVYNRTMNIADLPAGTYIATVSAGSEVMTTKIVKQ